jgi:hypothetical protein
MSELSETLATVQKLQRDARRARKGGDFAAAGKALQNAATILQKEWDSIASATKPGVAASEEVRIAAEMLADILGSLAGIQRRQGRDAEALENYRQGMAIEQNERYLVTSTYNRVQWLVLGVIMRPETVGSVEVQSLLAQTLGTLQRQIATTRRDDPWALCDLVLLAALADDRMLAEEAFRLLTSLNPVSDVYVSGFRVLEQLHETLPGNAAIGEAIQWYAPFCSSLK